jgi:ribose transport system ATP-binding protein
VYQIISEKVRKLSIAHRQIVEIAKALSEKVRILILDEPSAVLGPYEIQRLFDTLRRLRREGVAIIYITHHMSEIFQITDRVSVLKDGASSKSRKISETDKETIIHLMLGRSLENMYPDRSAVIGEEILKVSNIRSADNKSPISFEVKGGEVLGIAGLVGSGRTETLRTLFGADKKTGGEVFISGKRKEIRSPNRAVREGIGMVPEDRKDQGLVLPLSIRQNISLANFNKTTGKLGFLKSQKERMNTLELIEKLSIKATGPDMKVSAWGGGREQKVSLAKGISRDCRVMSSDEPTRGIDIGAKVEIYNLINEIASRGIAVIVVSSETAELLGICDRIMVMRKGMIQGEIKKKDFSEETVLRLSIGA